MITVVPTVTVDTLCILLIPQKFYPKLQQDAELLQRDRAAGCIIVFAKSIRLEPGDNILRTL